MDICGCRVYLDKYIIKKNKINFLIGYFSFHHVLIINFFAPWIKLDLSKFTTFLIPLISSINKF